MKRLFLDNHQHAFSSIGTALANSVESDLGYTSRIYIDKVTLTLHHVTLSSQKPCQHNNKCDCSKMKFMFFLKIKYRYGIIVIDCVDETFYWILIGLHCRCYITIFHTQVPAFSYIVDYALHTYKALFSNCAEVFRLV